MSRPEVQKLCPRCGGKLVIRINRATRSEFLGCERWSPGSTTHCDHTEPLPEWFRMVRAGAPTLPGFGT